MLPSGDSPSVGALAERVSDLGRKLADVEQEWRLAVVAHRQAKLARQEDQRLLTRLSETVAADRLFHGLSPSSCPRCEAPVGSQRRAKEAADHVCAICTSPLDPGDGDVEPDEQTQELQLSLEASSAAESIAREALEDAERSTSQLTERLRDAEGELVAAQSARTVAERAELEAAVSRAEGALAILAEDAADDVVSPVAPVGTDVIAILQALEKELEAEMRAVSSELLLELGEEIASLAHDFGIEAITEVKPDLRGALSITKGGAAAGGFGSQSPGERLRLRLATVIALLRVGNRRGISTHPGLLLLDSLRAEEVQESDAHAVLAALIAIARDTPGLQIISTTADLSLPAGRLSSEHVIAPDPTTGAVW